MRKSNEQKRALRRIKNRRAPKRQIISESPGVRIEKLLAQIGREIKSKESKKSDK